MISVRRLARRAWLDVAVVVWLAWIFDAINNIAPVRQVLAEQHGQQVLDLEHSLHLAPELALNGWLAAHHLAAQIVVLWYENVHGIVTFAVIGWLWWRRRDILAPLRATLIAVNVVALAVFWSFPVAPPRMLGSVRFLDLVASFHGLDPIWRHGSVALDSNQLAALPSLHIAWAAWVVLAIWRVSSRRWVRGLALVYPLLTLFAVMATANHYLADAVSGALLTAVVALAVERLAAARAGRRRRVSARARRPAAPGQAHEPVRPTG